MHKLILTKNYIQSTNNEKVNKIFFTKRRYQRNKPIRG